MQISRKADLQLYLTTKGNFAPKSPLPMSEGIFDDCHNLETCMLLLVSSRYNNAQVSLHKKESCSQNVHSVGVEWLWFLAYFFYGCLSLNFPCLGSLIYCRGLHITSNYSQKDPFLFLKVTWAKLSLQILMIIKWWK